MFNLKNNFNILINNLIFIELNRKDPEVDFKVDIGFQPSKMSRSALSAGYMEYVKQVRKNPEMERKARRKECELLIKYNY